MSHVDEQSGTQEGMFQAYIRFPALGTLSKEQQSIFLGLVNHQLRITTGYSAVGGDASLAINSSGEVGCVVGEDSFEANLHSLIVDAINTVYQRLMLSGGPATLFAALDPNRQQLESALSQNLQRLVSQVPDLARAQFRRQIASMGPAFNQALRILGNAPVIPLSPMPPDSRGDDRKLPKE
ncbi:MAG: hypothetical protein WCG83_06460 [Candidatus Peregrinibacteria bacterium]